MISIYYGARGSVLGHQFSCLRFLRLMGREFRVRVAFEPSRLAAEHLEHAYEFVVPIARRQINKAPAATATQPSEHDRKSEKRA